MTSLFVGPLVRATGTSSVVIWAEYTAACRVTLRVFPIEAAEDTPASSRSAHTVMVGGRHYVALSCDELQPATWYTYRLETREQEEAKRTSVRPFKDITYSDTSPQFYCFRTMNAVEAEQPVSEMGPSQLRLAYGSCRKSEEQQRIDALSAFGSWLAKTYEQREARWPHFLLLIGDQIYADQPPLALTRAHPHLEQGASTFADFALLYEHAWTKDKGVRQVFAALPTYMIFDDHEITNNWNIAPTWRADALRNGMEQVLIDGLVAYWVYQAWGNLERRTSNNHSSLLTLMQKAEQSGEDIIEALRAHIKQDIYGKADLYWHYSIPTTPPIFVMNVRTNRTSVFEKSEQELYAPIRIMNQQQMSTLQAWMHTHQAGLSLLVSSVPVLLPPVIGVAEYLAGKRLWQKSIAPLRRLGQWIARFQQKVALRMSFDHWPVYSATWQEFVHLLDECDQDIIVLSGDVHFSYGIEAHRTRRGSVRLYQFVSTPLQNALESKDQKLIAKQGRIAHLSYGGLRTRVLPLYTSDMKARLPHDLLFQNTLAQVNITLKGKNRYDVQQEYIGIVDGEGGVIGRTIVARGSQQEGST